MVIDTETIKVRLETASKDDEIDSPSLIIISKLYDQIRSLKDAGLSWAKIVSLISKDGIAIKPNTFSAAFSRFEKRKKTEERKRKALENKAKPKAEKTITTSHTTSQKTPVKPPNRTKTNDEEIEGMVKQSPNDEL